jgi:hypothetical protein
MGWWVYQYFCLPLPSMHFELMIDKCSLAKEDLLLYQSIQSNPSWKALEKISRLFERFLFSKLSQCSPSIIKKQAQASKTKDNEGNLNHKQIKMMESYFVRKDPSRSKTYLLGNRLGIALRKLNLIENHSFLVLELSV